ncbi:MAG: GGDEF domain-containing protein [Burkholderiales bacterium]|nr:GGDEF domain-containing protein [Burkholderiales bacterium]MDE2626763.1 GGDEF domain-containing protein [Burkholderiales bacterium]
MTLPTQPSGPLRVVTQIALPASAAVALEMSGLGPFAVVVGEGRDEWLAHLAEGGCDVLILIDHVAGNDAGTVDGNDIGLEIGDALDLATAAAGDAAIVVVAAELDPARVLDWLRRGAQDVLRRGELRAPSLPLRLRAAIERKRLERLARTAYATDVDTGLPHQQQLIEHMSQLIALREREPAPMAVLALRIEGLATTEARLGRAAASVLRRKVAVRLRAGVRASDVVASLPDDHYAVLLGSILTPADAARVGAKLLKALLEPFPVSGHDTALAVAIGIGQYPQDGLQPEPLLRRALGLAAAAQAQGRPGFANFGEAGESVRGAANDE